MNEVAYTCTACENFTTIDDVMLTAHQSICEKIDEDSQAYRIYVLSLFVGNENIERAQELARSHAERG